MTNNSTKVIILKEIKNIVINIGIYINKIKVEIKVIENGDAPIENSSTIIFTPSNTSIANL